MFACYVNSLKCDYINSGCSLTEILNHLISFSFFQLVHFVNRDSLGLANDFLSLGFIPEGVDIQAVSDALQASFVGARQSNDFQVSTEIADFWLSDFCLFDLLHQI